MSKNVPSLLILFLAIASADSCLHRPFAVAQDAQPTSYMETKITKSLEAIFNGKGQCASCQMPPFFLDDMTHELQVECFYSAETIRGQHNIADGPIKTFTLRGIKDSPPYHYDGRLVTLDDTVEFFNLVLGLKSDTKDKEALVAYLPTL